MQIAGKEIGTDKLLLAVVAVALLAILFLVLYNPAPTDDQVKQKITRTLVGRSITYRPNEVGTYMTFNIAEQQIRSVKKQVDPGGTTLWVACWESGQAYAMNFYFDKYADAETGAENVPAGHC